MNNNDGSANNSDSQAVLNQVILEYMREQKRKQFWRWFTRILVLGFVLWVAYQISVARGELMVARSKPHVGLIEIRGAIFENQSGSGDHFKQGLSKAYEHKSMKALIIRIDSPGGSPVQADYMYHALNYYREKFPAVKTYAVCVDACVSAAYYVAAAADEIYANPSSMVGSIGVVYNGFGFVDSMQKLGVSRRLHTAGRYKAFLDQFSPAVPDQEQKLQTMLNLIHQQFIDKVKEGRGSRLRIDNDTFSGLYWTGIQAKERGLIDGFASSGQLARDVIGIEKIVDYTRKESILERVSKNVGTAIADQMPVSLGIKPGVQAFQ